MGELCHDSQLCVQKTVGLAKGSKESPSLE
mgnify:CR=1 FL=1